MIKKNKVIIDKHSKKTKSPSSESSYSSESSDSADDVPSGFTSDSYSDDGEVFTNLTWPTWTLFCRSLGLCNVQWFANIGVIRMPKFFGTLSLESDHVLFHVLIGPLHQTIRISYQDVVESDSVLSIERAEQIKFVGSVGQYRKLRRRLGYFLFECLLPLAQQVPFDSDIHERIALSLDASDEDESDSRRSNSARPQSGAGAPPPSQPRKKSSRSNK